MCSDDVLEFSVGALQKRVEERRILVRWNGKREKLSSATLGFHSNSVGSEVTKLRCIRGHVFFAKYGGPSGGSLLLGGGIIILHVIRRHFLVAAVDPAVSLSMYSPRPMEAVP